jgi:glutaredoxin 3
VSKQVLIYSSAWCGYCHRARSLLQSKNIEFQELVIDGDTELRRQMIEKAGRQTVPQIFIGDRHIGGCEELVRLELTGELDQLLAGSTATA